MARYLNPVFFVSLGICQVYAQIMTTATCLVGMEWLSNSVGQSPCQMLAATLSTCLGSVNVPRWSEGVGVYESLPPYANPDCGCSDVVYNLMQACIFCQRGSLTDLPLTGSYSSGSWFAQCNARGVYDAGLPGDRFAVPIPHWAQIVPTRASAFASVSDFNPQLAQMVAGLGLSDAMDDESVQRWTVATDGTGTSLVAAAITATTSLASSTLLATTTSQPSAGPSTTITNSQDTLPKSTDVWSEQTTRGQSGNSTDTQGSQALQNPNMVVPIGMIVGGISGGLVLLIMALGMYWWYLRHMRTRGTRELDMLESAADSRRRPGVSSPHHVITPYPVPRQDPATIPLAIIPPHRHKPSLASASSSSTFTPGHYYAGSQSSAFTASPTSKFGTMSDGYMWSPVSEQNRQIRPSLILEQQNLIIEQLQMLKEQVALQSRSRSASASADLHSSSPSLSRTSTLPPPRYS